MITNDVSDYINLLVRIAHIICNRLLLFIQVITQILFNALVQLYTKFLIL
jgi:hypothetical protein